MKLPRLMSHLACACGIIDGQSAIKQLRNERSFTYEKAKHLSEPKLCDIANYGTIFKKNRVTLSLLSGF
jgi:hypothetical protein